MLKTKPAYDKMQITSNSFQKGFMRLLLDLTEIYPEIGRRLDNIESKLLLFLSYNDI
jgi:hypothetical protein